MLQILVGLVLALLSIDSIGLVSDDDFSLNWALAIPALIVLATVGSTVAFIARHPRWLRIGALSTVLAIVAAPVAILVLRSLAAGLLLFVIVQLLLPPVISAHQSTDTHPSV